eukprot:4011780-Lingulodinium_polyedra.AAC.1
MTWPRRLPSHVKGAILMMAQLAKIWHRMRVRLWVGGDVGLARLGRRREIVSGVLSYVCGQLDGVTGDDDA